MPSVHQAGLPFTSGLTFAGPDTLERPVHVLLEAAVADAQQRLAGGLAVAERGDAERPVQAPFRRQQPPVALVLQRFEEAERFEGLAGLERVHPGDERARKREVLPGGEAL